MRTQPKKNITKINKKQVPFGKQVRLGYQKKILDKSVVFPKPLEYDDIDKAVFEFVENEIDIAVDGEKVPTYTLYSNQRFSEYSQMWEHSDENGNLYLNFKTVNRDKNPSFGGNQGNLWNVPGNRRYTLLQKDVLDDNGTESIEVYSMSQPYTVDLTYTINFITVTLENLNVFNQKINKLFASRQHYIRPNGHFIPMVIDDISDETSYSISDRKFYVQSVTIKLMAYIIEKDDFEVKRFPKKTNIITDGISSKKSKNCVQVEEEDNPMKNKTLNVNMTFEPYHNTTEFTFDTDMTVESVFLKNVRNYRVMVNDTLYYTQKGFKLKNEDKVFVKITPLDYEQESMVQFIGFEEGVYYNSDIITETVSEEIPTHEEIIIE